MGTGFIKEEDKPLDAHVAGARQNPIMTDADMAMKMDPEYRKISEKFYNDFDYFNDVFARAWFKLTHRDLGPKSRYLGAEVPAEDLVWQDPIPTTTYSLSAQEIQDAKKSILNCGVSEIDLINTAWDSAVHLEVQIIEVVQMVRIRLSPQKFWEGNEPVRLEKSP